MKLSILMCRLKSRDACVLIDNIQEQIEDIGEDIELLEESDSGEISTGQKRNNLLKRAKGDYVCFVDDDDQVSNDYLARIVPAIQDAPDVVGIRGNYFIDGAFDGVFEHSIRHSTWSKVKSNIYLRCPNHLNPVKRTIALQVMFPDQTYGEDSFYSKRLYSLLKKEVMIIKPIYNYYAVQK